MPDTLDPDYLNSIIDYNLDTGICYWKSRPRTDFRYAREHKSWNSKHESTQIYHTNPSSGKLVVSLFGKGWTLDHLLWAMVTGEQNSSVYHLNQCNADNRWNNLVNTPIKATKYVGGELCLTKNSQGIYLIASGPTQKLIPPVDPHPGIHVFNFFLTRKDARTYLLELVDKLECGWIDLDEEY